MVMDDVLANDLLGVVPDSRVILFMKQLYSRCQILFNYVLSVTEHITWVTQHLFWLYSLFTVPWIIINQFGTSWTWFQAQIGKVGHAKYHTLKSSDLKVMQAQHSQDLNLHGQNNKARFLKISFLTIAWPFESGNSSKPSNWESQKHIWQGHEKVQCSWVRTCV